MKITTDIQNLCEVAIRLKQYSNLDDKKWEVNFYYEFDYEHNIELEIKSKIIDSRLIFKIDREYNLVSYEVKGREKDTAVYTTYQNVIRFMEDTFYTTSKMISEYLQDQLRSNIDRNNNLKNRGKRDIN